jgi:hypothetical protein
MFPTCDNMIFLEKGFRQNDSSFLQILNEIRRGFVSIAAEALLHQKVVDFHKQKRNNNHNDTSIHDIDNGDNNDRLIPNKKKKRILTKPIPTKLFSVNKSVDQHNNDELRKLKASSYYYRSEDQGREQFLNQIRSGMKAPEILELKVGCQVGICITLYIINIINEIIFTLIFFFSFTIGIVAEEFRHKSRPSKWC